VGLKLQKIGKGKTKVLLAFLSLSIILSSFLIQKAYGSMKEDYEYSELSWDGNLVYQFKVKVIIETENDGTWIPSVDEHWYHIDYVITLDYINKTRIKSLIFFYHYSIPISGLQYISFRAIENETEVMEYSGQTGVLSFKITAYPQAFSPRLRIIPQFEFNYTYSETWSSAIGPYGKQWRGIEPIYIDKKEPSQVSESLSIVVIGMVIGVGIGMGSILLGIKIEEKRSKKKKVNP